MKRQLRHRDSPRWNSVLHVLVLAREAADDTADRVRTRRDGAAEARGPMGLIFWARFRGLTAPAHGSAMAMGPWPMGHGKRRRNPILRRGTVSGSDTVTVCETCHV